jgi:FdhD protein
MTPSLAPSAEPKPERDHALSPSVAPVGVQRWQAGAWQAAGEDRVAEEVPVALVINGVSHTVMMASPSDLPDFALGFAFTEGLIDGPEQLYGVDVHTHELGLELQLEVASACAWRLRERRRSQAGSTGCGLCGADNLQQVQRALPPVQAVSVPAAALARAEAQLHSRQSLQHATGATHAAAWFDDAGNIQCVREDVGRHNALDKLIGALLRAGSDVHAGGVLITSRASFEMVQKTVALGAAVLAAVSAPTALAVRVAQTSGLCLAGFVRPGGFVAYTHPERLQSPSRG